MRKMIVGYILQALSWWVIYSSTQAKGISSVFMISLIIFGIAGSISGLYLMIVGFRDYMLRDVRDIFEELKKISSDMLTDMFTDYMLLDVRKILEELKKISQNTAPKK